MCGGSSLSYRQTIAAYPNGGGSYTVARENLGCYPGFLAASSLLLDYTLNVAVGISAGVGALESAFPALQSHTVSLCLAVLAILTFANLRGVRDVGMAWAIPTYTFILSLSGVVVVGLWKALAGGGHPSPVIVPPPLPAATASVSLWILMRAFASGCTAMTGVEAVSNAVPLFRKPAVDNARRTLVLICISLGFLLGGVGFLVHAYKIGALSQENPGYESIISQLTSAIVGRGAIYYVTIGGVLSVLVLSANTSFAGFPRVCHLLADDKSLPSAFSALGRRLVYTPGILILAAFSGVLLVLFGGITDRLIPLFAVGAFTAFTMSQTGMVVHWRRQGKGFTNPGLLINAFGAVATAGALIVIFVAKFAEGAWLTVLVIPAVMWVFYRVRKHYDCLQREISPLSRSTAGKVLPLKVVIPVESWNRPAERALQLALRISDDVTIAHVTINEPDEESAAQWRDQVQEPVRAAGFPKPEVKVIHSPYRKLAEPFLKYVRAMQKAHPEHQVAVVIPEIVQPRWWEYLLHSHAAKALRSRLLADCHDPIVVIDAPWHTRE
jgi:amino acid transporter